MLQQASDQWPGPGPDGGAWATADAMLDAWLGTVNANAGEIIARIAQYTEWAAAAMAAMETAAAGLTGEQKAHIQSGVAAILQSFPEESWIRASRRATDCLQGDPTLQRLLTFERIRQLQDKRVGGLFWVHWRLDGNRLVPTEAGHAELARRAAHRRGPGLR